MNAEDAKYRWQVLLIVMIGTLMAALDQSIVNVSLPAIMADFGASLDDIEWVITGYMLSFATLMPLTSWFRDRVGHKNLFLMSLIIFTLGSLFCGMAWNLPSLIVARVIQAFGGGAITPTGMAMVSEVFPPRERGKALGYWGVGVIVGPAIGPTLGGFLTNTIGWRSIFLVNLPIGLLGIILGLAILRADKPHPSTHRPFDFWGFAFLSAFLVSFLLGLSKGEHEGWMSSYILTCFIISTLGFIGFLTVETLVPNGIMDLRLFKSAAFSACMVVTAMRSVALFGGTFLLPVFLQRLVGLDEIQSGLILLPGALVIGALMPVAGRLSDRIGPRLLSLLGMIGVAMFMYLYRNLDLNTSTWGVIYPTLIRGLGIGLLIAPVMATALNSVPKEKTGMASAMLNLIQQVSGSIGIAALATTLSHRTKFHLNVMGATLQSRSPTIMKSFYALSARAHELGYNRAASSQVARAMLTAHIQQTSSVAGFQDAFLMGGLIVVLGTAAVFLLPGRKAVARLHGEHLALE